MDTVTNSDHSQVDNPGLQPEHTLSIDQTAAALGLSVTTVRRRIKRGDLRAIKADGPHGPEYRVILDHPDDSQSPTVASGYRRDNGRSVGTDNPSLDSLITLVKDLTNQNARLQDERAELYGRVGFLQAKLQEAEGQVKLLAAPALDTAPQASESPATRAPWWQFWRRPAPRRTVDNDRPRANSARAFVGRPRPNSTRDRLTDDPSP